GLDIRPNEGVEEAALARDLGRTPQRLKRDELSVSLRLGTLDHIRKREANPGDHHRPTLDAAMAINALLEREGLDEIIERIIGRLVDETVNLQGPGFSGEGMGILAGVAFTGAKFVIVVVTRHIFERRRLFVR